MDASSQRRNGKHCATPISAQRLLQNNDAGAATEHADAWALPLDLPTEFLIGIQEDDARDPVDLMIVFQNNLEFAQETGKRVQTTGTEEAADAAATLAAEKTKHAATLVDLRRLANNMGVEYLFQGAATEHLRGQI